MSVFIFCTPVFAKKTKTLPRPKPVVIQKLNKQTNDELAKNEEVQGCYLRAKAGQEKQHGVVYVDIEVGMRSEVISIALNKGQSTLSPEVGNCITEELKNLIDWKDYKIEVFKK